MTAVGNGGTARLLPRRLRCAVSSLVFLMTLSFCGPGTEEARFRRFFEAVIEQAEKGDLAGIVDRLAPDYLDFEGRNRDGARALVADYLENRRGIVIHLLSTRIEGRDPQGRTLARAEIMISSGAAEALRRLVSFTGEYFRFDFGLTEAGEGWLIRSAKWEHLATDELLPESLTAVKKLFSGK